MKTGGTSLGEIIRNLRTAKGMTRAELSEIVDISESHLKKIEAGVRQPGINTYQKIMEVLGVEYFIKNGDETVKEKCATKVQNILLNSTDKEAVYLTKMIEYMAKNLELIL